MSEISLRKPMQSGSWSNHALGRNQPTHNESGVIVDYTGLPGDISVEGHLSNGTRAECTTRCPKCQRIGLASAVRAGFKSIVHRGRVTGSTLEGIDVCQIQATNPSDANRHMNEKTN